MLKAAVTAYSSCTMVKSSQGLIMQLDFDDDPEGRPSKLAVSISIAVLLGALVIAAQLTGHLW
ncbi:hypothetical protein [Phyllobacterium endophyticum]|uniref:hypothetical protein n=1 Tax=Phyllobacterium endophyticum TaxID=1149773 RepID=UPI0011CBA7F5|nr:hypothetical protein [Phyllobacterium endophyticum]TXR46566.1 hypothetical protein FVA77_24365 [Phyllobacterium endophyticum]